MGRTKGSWTFRYYLQRYSYFSMYDQGILMDRGKKIGYLVKVACGIIMMFPYLRGMVLGDA